jgi:thermitase
MNLYWISFLAAFISLGLWFFAKKPIWIKVLRTIFWGSTAIYSVELFSQDAPMLYRLQALMRDFLFMGFFGGVFAVLTGHRRWIIPGIGIALLAVFLFIRGVQSSTFPHIAPTALDKKGELLVELRPGTTPATLSNLQKRFGIQIKRAFFPQDSAITLLDQYYVADIPDWNEHRIRRIIRILQRNNAVAWVEENEEIEVDPFPQKTTKTPGEDAVRYGLNDPGISNLWAFREMAMDQLYTLLEERKIKPSKKVLIAILDTGVDARHEDIGSNYTSLKAGYDNDPKGHGTHCAGIAAAVSNNGRGIASFSRDNAFYSVTSVKVLGAGGMGTQKMIIDGILFAVDQGADVLSMSLGGPGNQAAQRAYAQAVAYAAAKGAIVVAAAGNSNRNARDFSPANVRGVLCVSAIDERLDRAPFSNYVREIPLAVAAPGVDIYSTIPGNQYERYSGTSMAAPQVAGLVALLKSLKPDLGAEAVHEILEKSGKATKDTPMTGKLIYPAGAVRLALSR